MRDHQENSNTPEDAQGEDALPTLHCGSENWSLTQSQGSRNQATEMTFLTHVSGFLQDRRRNADIRQELNIMTVILGLPNIG